MDLILLELFEVALILATIRNWAASGRMLLSLFSDDYHLHIVCLGLILINHIQ